MCDQFKNLRQFNLQAIEDALFNGIRFISKQEIFTLSLVVFVLIFCVAIDVINYFFLHFKVAPPWIVYEPLLPILAMWYAGCVLEPYKLYLSLCLRLFALYLFTIACFFLGAHACLLTPFKPWIDPWLLHVDQLLGFKSAQLLAWVHAHAEIKPFLVFAYNAWVFEVLIVPLVLLFLGHFKKLMWLIHASLISIIVGGLIYFFLPSLPPASVVHSAYFLDSSHILIQRFFDLRKHLPLDPKTLSAGLISFPSFHVINALLSLMAIWHLKYVRWPLLFLNVVLVLSTMMLGFHYLVDVIAAIVIVVCSGHVAVLLSQVSPNLFKRG